MDKEDITYVVSSLSHHGRKPTRRDMERLCGHNHSRTVRSPKAKRDRDILLPKRRGNADTEGGA